MGYKRNKVYLLTFDDPEFEGLEIRCKGASIGAVTGAVSFTNWTDKDFTPEMAKDLPRVVRILAGCSVDCIEKHDELPEGQTHYANRIVSWNLEEEDGTAVPANYEGLLSQDIDFVMAVCFAWMDGVVGTPGPLDGNSLAGGQSVEALIPMETSSLALPN